MLSLGLGVSCFVWKFWYVICVFVWLILCYVVGLYKEFIVYLFVIGCVGDNLFLC